jgi:hypothetical protein
MTASMGGQLPGRNYLSSRIEPGLQTGLQLGKVPFPVASTELQVTRDNARLLPAAVPHFRSFFALVMRSGLLQWLRFTPGARSWGPHRSRGSGLPPRVMPGRPTATGGPEDAVGDCVGETLTDEGVVAAIRGLLTEVGSA